MRVYIAKITFTTLIDHFTSLDAESSLVLSDQLIKLELLTQSIRQQKLPPHAVRFAAFDPAVRMALAGVRGTAAVASCFGKTLGIIPIETLHFIRNHSVLSIIFRQEIACLSTRQKFTTLCMVYIIMSKTEGEVRQFRERSNMFLLKNHVCVSQVKRLSDPYGKSVYITKIFRHFCAMLMKSRQKRKRIFVILFT
ncbi:MAG: hypothetical protein V8S57_01595 [Oscillospiraceae bacterium]